jgi:hypothetical protein
MRQETDGWLIYYDIKGQCANCLNVVKDHKMAACDFARAEFGNAHNCPVYRFDWKDEK